MDLTELLALVNNMAELDDAALTQLDADLRSALDALVDDPTDANLELADQAATAIEAVAVEQTTRVEAEQARSDRAQALRERVAAEPEVEVVEDDTVEPVAAEVVEPVEPEVVAEPVAAALPVATRVAARRPAATRPRPRPSRELSLVAAPGHPTVQAGTVLDDPLALASAFVDAHRASTGVRSGITKIPVARFGTSAEDMYGRDRTMRMGDAVGNTAILDRLGSPSAVRRAGGFGAITAAGGICAPTEIDYSMPVVGTDDRPVRDQMLVRVGAERGGIRTFPVPHFTDLNDGVSIWTEANDQLPVEPAVKPCISLTCPDADETLVDALTRCVEVGNFRARFFPEQVAQWLDLAGIAHARIAENNLLEQIAAGSTQVTGGVDTLGAALDVLADVERAATAIRSRWRLGPSFPLRLGVPFWLFPLMRTDILRQASYGTLDEKMAAADAKIAGWFTARNITVTQHLDGETGGPETDQIFGLQGDGPLQPWPDQVIMYLYPEGSWNFLDGGTLDLGIIRDSTLTDTNDYRVFAESFEAAHFHGIESERIVLDICPSGRTSGPDDAFDPCLIGS